MKILPSSINNIAFAGYKPMKPKEEKKLKEKMGKNCTICKWGQHDNTPLDIFKKSAEKTTSEIQIRLTPITEKVYVTSDGKTVIKPTLISPIIHEDFLPPNNSKDVCYHHVLVDGEPCGCKLLDEMFNIISEDEETESENN